MSTWPIVALAVIFLTISAFGLVVWRGVESLTRPPRMAPASHPRDFDLPYEQVEFPSRDGITLRGWFIPAAALRASPAAEFTVSEAELLRASPANEARGTVVFCHGHGGHKDPDLKYAPWFHAHGYNVLLFDFHGHGQSDGGRISLVYHERQDLLGALDYLRGRGIVQVGVIGFSMGAAVAMATAPLTPAIRAVVADSGFVELRHVVEYGARERGLPGWVARPLSGAVLWLADRVLGVHLSEADPIRWVGRISPRPLFIIHGGRDAYIPLADVQRLYAAAGEPKELWIEAEAGHRGVEDIKSEEYRKRVLGFFDQWLR